MMRHVREPLSVQHENSSRRCTTEKSNSFALMPSGVPPFSATNHSLCALMSCRIACSSRSTLIPFWKCVGFAGDIERYANIPAELSNRSASPLMKPVFLTGAVRTPIGRFGGSLASWTAADLGTAAAKESLRRANIKPDQVDDSIWGCARQAGGGPNVARQITFRAAVPESVPAFTVNQACGSGLRAILLASEKIMLGRANIVLAGGTESMSRVPYFAEGARWGMRMGHTELVDGMYRDGFNDPLSGLVMGETAEELARRYEIARDEQDEYALRSQQRAVNAIATGRFNAELLPLELKSGKRGTSPTVREGCVAGDVRVLARDEHVRDSTTIENLRKLPSVFAKDGTVTAGNSSGITDGAAAVVVMSEAAL